MNINEYLLPTAKHDWSELLSDWNWLLPKSYTVWLANRFGDLFLVLDKGKVQMLDLGAGTLKTVAASRDQFYEQIGEEEIAESCLLISLTDKCVADGMVPRKKECYSFKIIPALGGQFEVDNVEVTDISVHYSISGQLHEQIKDLPAGTKVGKIQVSDGKG